MKSKRYSTIVFLLTSAWAVGIAAANEPWVIDSQAQWQKYTAAKSGRELDKGVAHLTQEKGLRIKPPADLGKSMYAWAFEIFTDNEQHSPNGNCNG